MSLSAPSKHLRYSETDFTGYWVQLNALIRHNDHADRVLDQILVNPLNTLCNLADDSQLKADLQACYTANNFGFPPSEQLLREVWIQDPGRRSPVVVSDRLLCIGGAGQLVECVCVCRTQVTQLGVCVVTQGTQSSLGGVGAHAQSVLRRD